MMVQNRAQTQLKLSTRILDFVRLLFPADIGPGHFAM